MAAPLKKLEAMRERFRELDRKLSTPEAAGAPDYPGLLREHGALAKIVPAYEEYLKVKRHREEAEELAAGSDADMAELARAELPALRAAEEKGLADVKRLAFTEDASGDRDVIMEIRAATGGTEAGLFASDLLKLYKRFCDRRGLKMEITDEGRGEKDSLREAVMMISGKGAWRLFKYEGGGHRVQRVPETEAQGRIHTSLATVAVLPKVDPVELKIRPEDLDISVSRAGGPGGQGVNTTDSAVRIVHKPSGLQVRCIESRSQRQNRERGMEILRAKLFELEQTKQASAVGSSRRAQIGSGDRSERVRTYNFPQNRVTDHRLEGEEKNYSLEKVMAGDLDEIIAALESQAAAAEEAEGNAE
ncbi:MAG TPA: peptide chain release factor 1 [Planctomycetota bacterium]|nr:peptide chain release factor 1 [Planctomycetota bacterium]